MKFAWLLLLALSLAPDPYRIVPGQGFGRFRASLGMKALQKGLHGSEYGESENSAEIYMFTPSQRIEVGFTGDRVRSMAANGDSGLHSVWHTAEGVSCGTPLTTLARLNGRPFRFLGPGGDVLDWGGGRLARSWPGVKITFASNMFARGYRDLDDAEHQSVEQERVFRSDEPVAVKLNPVVGSIELDF